mgnify:CR=1 FL=1
MTDFSSQQLSPAGSLALPHIRPSIGQSPVTGLMQDRYNQLIKEFKAIDVNKDDKLTYEEIYKFLSEKQGQNFDESLCQELFAKMDKNKDSVVTTDEFLWSYVDAEDLIMRRIRELKQELESNDKELQKVKKNLVEARTSEKINKFGVMEGSVLTVHVIEAQNLIPMDRTGSSDPYVVLECEGKKIQTRYIPQDLNPVWDEVFTFMITEGTGDLKVTVMDYDKGSEDDFEGEVNVPINILSDQMKHDQYFTLVGKEPDKKWQGRIHLGLQWVWSKVKYYESLAEQWQETIDADAQEVGYLKEQLEKLRKPFGHIINPQYFSGSSVKPYKLEETLAGKLDEFTKGKLSIVAYSSPLFALVLFSFLVLSSLSMFIRPDFLDLSIGLGALMFRVLNQESVEWYRKLSFVLAFSQVWDIVWLWHYTSKWSEDHAESHVRSFGVFISYVNFAFKFVVLGVFWKRSLE